MAANTPMLLKAAMVDGRPDLGVMASGQVVGVIDDLPTVRRGRRAHRSPKPRASPGEAYNFSMMVTLAWPPPSHIVWRP